MRIRSYSIYVLSCTQAFVLYSLFLQFFNMVAIWKYFNSFFFRKKRNILSFDMKTKMLILLTIWLHIYAILCVMDADYELLSSAESGDMVGSIGMTASCDILRGNNVYICVLQESMLRALSRGATIHTKNNYGVR